jgi:hypothetical protein
MRVIIWSAVILGSLLCQDSFALHFCAYGDSRTNALQHKAVCDAINARNPELVVHSGDLWDGYSAVEWKSHLTANPVLNGLLSANRFLIARGNHETDCDVRTFQLPIVRDNSLFYCFTQGNCFFVCLGYDPGANNAWLEQQLSSDASQSADWRFVFAHKPVYSSGSSHGADGVTSERSAISRFRQLCDQYHVTAYFYGHDHFYERTHLICDGDTVSSGEQMPADRGTVYIVTGGGGAPLHGAGSHWWTNTSSSIRHFCDITADSRQCAVTVLDDAGNQLDHFSLRRPDPASDTDAPLITVVGPIGTLFDTTATLRVTTDEKAAVRWSLSDESYGAMPNQFFTAVGARLHTADFTGRHGQVVSLFVRAMDASGNVSSSSTRITFAIDTALSTVSWKDPRHDAEKTGWLSGPSQLGYGDCDEATVVASGTGGCSEIHHHVSASQLYRTGCGCGPCAHAEPDL